jgi:hypothetical protein
MTRRGRQAGRDVAWERRLRKDGRRLPPPRWPSSRQAAGAVWGWMAFMSVLGRPSARTARPERRMVL